MVLEVILGGIHETLRHLLPSNGIRIVMQQTVEESSVQQAELQSMLSLICKYDLGMYPFLMQLGL